jgi:hypothetical protein
MDLSIIIVNWNTREFLRTCLRSIRQGASGLSVQTIVVDNASRDASDKMVIEEFPEVMIIQSGGNLGFARANNLALPHVQSSFVLFLNPDTEIQGHALSLMLDQMKRAPSVGALGCRIRNLNGTIQELGLQWFPSPLTELVRFLAISERTYSRFRGLIPYHSPALSGEVTKLFGACLLVRRTVLEQVGSFDERFFMYCEDVDLCHRISRAGWKLFYLSEAEILHVGGAAGSAAFSSFSVLMMCESLSKFMRKYYGRFGSASYRFIALGGAQFRLLAVFLAALVNFTGMPGTDTKTRVSLRKYLSVSKWALGLERPLIKN